ncbi:MAG: hypothetical protein CO034_03030 [Parcubacteria group bacterium CG_4_9_14_0_2_um_filter_35_11]|nr:MAG: hypothetical protein COS98_01520 [Parcubacteria group bacterium CG07_land_8_20_14_0_80_35_11]PJC47293.1 MAG: hypothetical protein CO034_03030 [Parcubacteria group bacterium CG_4_9_14_0_2_um_filter_35_11]
MGEIGIVTEEAADLPADIVTKHQIAIVPVKLDWPEIEKIPGENTFQKMRELEKRGIKSFGKTSQPSPNDFLDKYKYQLERFEKVLCITLTSKLSGSNNSANLAKKFLNSKDGERVFVVDSLNATAGQALLVLKAIDLINSGKTIEEIVAELEKSIPHIHLLLIFNDPKWIEASGRISHLAANLMRKMAQAGIRPLSAFKDGVLVPVGIRLGAKDLPTALFKQLEKETKNLRKAGKKIRVTIVHGDHPKSAQRLKEMIEKELKNTEVVFINVIGNVIGAPIGPDALACAWCEI